MPPLEIEKNGKALWRSLEDWAETPEFRAFVEDEFPSLAPKMVSRATRRQFLKLMGASLALAGVAGCRWPKETIAPYADRPKGRTPGVPVQYATAMEVGGVATGLLVTSYDGRPIKIEGNPQHPFSRGKTNAWQQASVLELYDPDRGMWPVRREGSERRNRTWDDFQAFAGPHFSALRDKQGAGLAVLSEAPSSPSLTEMKGRLLRAFPQAAWYEYEPISRDNEREGAKLAFGRPFRTHLHLDKADTIVSLDADFLMTHPAAVKYAGDFAAGRRGDNGKLSRLYVFESNYTVTGSMADERFAVRSALVPAIARRLCAEVGKLLPGSLLTVAEAPDVPGLGEALAALARDLVAHKGHCVVTAGHRQSPDVHALTHALNAALGSVGTTITYTFEPDADRPSYAEAISALTEHMNAGEVETLLILGGNPAYDVPAALGFEAALAKVGTSIRLGLHDDETSRVCQWYLPRAHYLESWGDTLAYDGTLSIIQPLIDPLYDGKTPCELLALLLGDELTSGRDITRRTFGIAFDVGVDRDALWKQSLHDGVVADSAWPTETPTVRRFDVGSLETADGDAFEIVLAEDYSVYDGRFANNGWLQEAPDPVTKLTWDNAALISPKDAGKLGAKKYGDMIRIEHAGNTLDVAAYPLPGHAEGSITLPLGYGRKHAGVVASEAGVDAYALLPVDGSYRLRGAKVTGTGKHYALATTQDHHAIRSNIGDRESARRVEEDLVKSATIGQFVKKPTFAKRDVVSLPLWQEWSYEDGHKWALAIDLSTCIGCSGCVVACQAENNIPVVGKEEVSVGREMHWIRVDRYFQGEPEQPDVKIVHQPMTCHHCENAPCEQVCPVAATTHDKEGINVMIYNRCIGTRYCNNNCPFKVRRFNWFWNHHGPEHPRNGEDLTDIEKMAHNPDVTVRSRGVMEKCSLCTQRINAVKIRAKNERWDKIPDGAITPACAQACPTDAIVFGDLNDPDSRIRKMHEDARSYELLPELNLKSRLLYLAKLTNPATGAGDELRDETHDPSA